MVNRTMSRVRVLSDKPNQKKNLFEVILAPEKASQVDFSIVITALRMLFPDNATISIEAYGI